MAWLAVDKDKTECIFSHKPIRSDDLWDMKKSCVSYNAIEIPKGSIEKLIGRQLTWEDEPVKINKQL